MENRRKQRFIRMTLKGEKMASRWAKHRAESRLCALG
jgi:hypothetical protein